MKTGEPTVASLCEAVRNRDFPGVRAALHRNPELVGMDLSGNDEHRALHFAVLQRDAEMVRLLMEAGADAHKGIYPHRDATSAFVIAQDRDYREIIAVIEEEERHRRAELSCPNASTSPIQDRINQAIAASLNQQAISLLDRDRSLVQACDRTGSSPLHVAAESGNQEMVSWLLDARADPRKQDAHGLLPIDRAALAIDGRNGPASEYAAIAGLLLNGGSPLTLRSAVALGDVDRVRELLEADPAAIDRIGRQGGLLTIAAKHGQLDAARLLLDRGADVDERVILQELEKKTESCGSPLWHAALAGDAAMTALLLERGADPNANVYASGWPLRNAWDHEDPTVKQMLLEKGAKLQPYMVAEQHDIREARRLLSSHPSKETVSELAWSAADHGCPEILSAALKQLPRPETPRAEHWLLIQPIRGAGPDESDKDAGNEGAYACLRLLLEFGLDPNAARFGQTALHFAAGYRGNVGEIARARFAKILLEHGASVKGRDDLLLSTPLGWACRWGRLKLATELIAHGAQIQEPDAEPWARPLAWARKMDHPLLADALLDHVSKT